MSEAKEQSKIISEHTLLPISLVIIVCSFAYSWAKLDSRMATNEKEVAELKADKKENQATLNSIKEGVAEIRGALRRGK